MDSSLLLKILKDRGFFYQATNEQGINDYLKTAKNGNIYIGFDCTASTLHIGSLVQLMILRQVQKLGLKPIILLGGATTLIGDPSGKDETRLIQTPEKVAENLNGIKNVIGQFIKFGDGASDAILVNNISWFENIKYLEFLRDVGRHFSVNRMLSFESVKMRLDREQNLSFLEFNYMLLQAYDFVELYRKHQCRIQIGGSDQWGNIVSGVELARRVGIKDELFGITTPLVTTASGQKMGKTASGAVWLTAKDLFPYDYWQFWRNTEDKDVGKFLRLFTELDLNEIERLEKLQGSDINQAKIILANEATKICHGGEAAEKACTTATQTFAEGKIGEDLPVVNLNSADLKQGISFYKLLFEANLCESGGAAKRLITGGGAKINDNKITDPEYLVGVKDLSADNVIKLSAGKKKHAVVSIIVD